MSPISLLLNIVTPQLENPPHLVHFLFSQYFLLFVF